MFAVFIMYMFPVSYAQFVDSSKEYNNINIGVRNNI